ncbi:MAG TPA: monovalent cation/H+ antiporter complex subunit F [Candidatus Hydrogenedens sp.]|nr:hypothetical protein [Candidatus Hydrogenedens sp.]HOK08489.1 monovalent cation/H+ antiporter complex subunit F [Candidatus Hydrogenedens sp.]HOL20347.1 monovalent cation/H+ antiporter complex subunit F [Candidatus Hydrogenedens sp.]HPP57841.1 monovalent cation/H+ antiporter complex subunit F [Candidatus Hydrogenedens sp.]
MLSISIVLFCILITLGILFALTRLVLGPTLADRVVALDLITTQIVGIIAVYCIAIKDSVYLIDAITITILSFLGTVTFAYYLNLGERQK